MIVIICKSVLTVWLIGVLDGSYTSVTLNVSLCILISSRTHYLTLVMNLVSPSYLPRILAKTWVIFQGDLSWAHHYDRILSKAYKTLGLLRRTFSGSLSVQMKRKLYILLIRSQLTCCSQLCCPALIKDIISWNKFNAFISSSWLQRLISLNHLPLMQFFEIANIMFMVNSLKNQSHRFNINKYVSIQNSNTRTSDKITLKHIRCGTYKEQHFLLLQNTKIIEQTASPKLITINTKSIKTKLFEMFWLHFQSHFDPDNSCTFHYLCPCSSCSKLPLSHSLFS